MTLPTTFLSFNLLLSDYRSDKPALTLLPLFKMAETNLVEICSGVLSPEGITELLSFLSHSGMNWNMPVSVFHIQTHGDTFVYRALWTRSTCSSNCLSKTKRYKTILFFRESLPEKHCFIKTGPLACSVTCLFSITVVSFKSWFEVWSLAFLERIEVIFQNHVRPELWHVKRSIYRTSKKKKYLSRPTCSLCINLNLCSLNQ